MPDSLAVAQNLVSNANEEIQSTSILELITSGGIVGTSIMILLLIALIIAIYIFFERYFTIEKSSHSNSDLMNHIRDFVYDGKIESAIDLCKRTHTPEARMIQKGLLRIGRPIKDISDSIEQTGQLEVYKLEKNINILATISGAAPMVGFLGTVIGMITAFYDLANSTGQVNAKLLSSGIYTAMGTTAAGLVVGIFAYIFYNLLVVKVGKTVYRLQSSVTDFLDLINKPIK
ncbi:MAG: MotA/TolQ/ExbB proton channel family protein [Flavobacteriales bacterium]|nr:MotA/TolQ/ExbB proton channel family protein [Flavobacteriales bacterium]